MAFRTLLPFFPFLFVTSVFGAAGCGDHAAQRAKSQVERVADDLDRRTTPTGVYVRIKDGELKEADPWGVPLRATYSQGGIAEMIDVRSAGPDREFHTIDDVVAERMAANMSGIGEGIKKNAEETASNMARGAVKGAIKGARESVQESWRRKRKEKKPPDEARSAVVPIETDRV